MKILIVGSVSLPIPPPTQGGTEWIAFHQAVGLSALGHEVTLVAKSISKDSFSNSNVTLLELQESEDKDIDPSQTESSRVFRNESALLSRVSYILINRKDQYDIVLNNSRGGEAVLAPVASLIGKPLVNVMHLNLFPTLSDTFRLYNTHIITISNAQRSGVENLNYLSTVYNGVDTSDFSFNPKPSDYLLMMGTIGRHKNQGAAIRVAKKSGMKLIMAGKIRDHDYYEEIKKDIDGEQIKLLGEIGFEEKVKLYQDAKAFLFPIQWNEPFGLVMIEAMSCGTPVIAFNRGAVPEVVEDGKTGFVVENEDEMVEAIKKIDTIDRAACRKRVEENFSVDKMIASYEKALQKI